MDAAGFDGFLIFDVDEVLLAQGREGGPVAATVTVEAVRVPHRGDTARTGSR